jgi:hypothetical protein
MAAPVDPRVDDSNPTSLTAVAASLHTIAIHEDTTTTCHILRLPAELHLTIGEVLAEDTSACPLHLRQTNRYFASLIPAPTSSDLFALEEQSWAKDKRLYACKFCVRLRKATHFADYMLRRSKWSATPEGRFCLDCGFAHLGKYVPGKSFGRYSPGTQIDVDGKMWIWCKVCEELKKGVASEVKGCSCSCHGMCKVCHDEKLCGCFNPALSSWRRAYHGCMMECRSFRG